uniref:Uncharacterized protein n=1 Tax=viral metagenome TaxID=1070528 RepID=A0A6C0B9Z4_9ZZZZ
MENIEHCIASMLEYQKMNNIKGYCIPNTQYLYNIATKYFPHNSVKAQAVLCFVYDDSNELIKRIVHMVLTIDGILYDPSYELYSLKNVSYFTNIEDLKQTINIETISKDTLDTFTRFQKYATMINNEISLIKITTNYSDYYNKQSKYIAIANNL